MNVKLHAERTSFGKYRVLALLGRGGMGDVYLAVNVGLAGVNKLVVIKELRRELAEVPEARLMFLDEARLATRLNHPNVVQTYEVVEEDSSLYLTMEFLDGQPLQRMIREKRGQFSLGVQLRILSDTLSGLHYAHELNDYDGTSLHVVHRDVSPHNIIATYDGAVKLVDFGIAKARSATTITDSGIFKGKVRFSAPEQVMCQEVDRRADVFGVGAALWCALTGESMWKNLPDAAVFVEIAAGRIPRARDVQPDIPEELDAICAKALAFEPGARFATADDFRNALLEYMRKTGDAGSELGASLATAFADERKAIREVIDGQLVAARRTPTETMRVRTVPILSIAPPATESAQRVWGMPHTPSMIPPRVRRAVAALGVVAVAACAALIVVLTLPRGHAMTVPGAAAGAPSRPAALPARPVDDRVHLRFSAQPPSARFAIDGVVVSTNPYETEVPGDTATHTIQVTADGFLPRDILARFDRDVAVDVALAAAPARTAVAAQTHGARAAATPRESGSTIPATRAPRAIEEEDPYAK